MVCVCIRCLTVDWLMKQMKYRYDIEIDLAKRLSVCLLASNRRKN